MIKTKFFAGRFNKINQTAKVVIYHLSFLSLTIFVILAVFPTFVNEFCWQCSCTHFLLNLLSRYASKILLTLSILDISGFHPYQLV